MVRNKESTILWNEFESCKQRNPAFSLRAFARQLDVSPASLSGFFQGKRALSFAMLSKISDRLALSPESRFKLMNSKSGGVAVLDEASFALIAEWQYFAILNLLKMDGFRPNAKWIAKRLGIGIGLAATSWKRLVDLNHVVIKEGRWVRSQARIHTSDETASLAVKRAHLLDLALIETSLRNDPLHRRDSTSLTFAISPKRIPVLKEAIRRFRSEVDNIAENSGGLDEVYKLCIHLIPLTQQENP